MNTPSISFIREATREASPHFFTRDTLRFFGQRVGMFKVWKGKSGAFYIAAPSYWSDRQTGRPVLMGVTFRKFTGSDLVNVEHPDFLKSMDCAREWVKQNG